MNIPTDLEKVDEKDALRHLGVGLSVYSALLEKIIPERKAKMEVTIELDDNDLRLMYSYYCHRNGHTQHFLGGPDNPDGENIEALENLLQKLCDAADYPMLEED